MQYKPGIVHYLNYDVFLSLKMKIDLMIAKSEDPDEMHFFGVFTLCRSTHLGVSSIQRINELVGLGNASGQPLSLEFYISKLYAKLISISIIYKHF